jgi:hypothetical protein
VNLDLTNFADPGISEEFIEYLVREVAPEQVRRQARLWSYYRNELSPLGSRAIGTASSPGWAIVARPYRQAQEFGLPARITGMSYVGYDGEGEPLPAIQRKEVVIENDIGWRIDAGVHFLAGQAVGMESLARRPEDARRIEAALAAVWAASGGQALLGEIALLGSVYGFVDIVVRLHGDVPSPTTESQADAATQAARAVSLEAVEAPRIVPVLDENDYRHLKLWVQVYRRQANRLDQGGWLSRIFGRGRREIGEVETIEILGPTWWQRYDDGVLVAEAPNPLGRVPVVHIQNLPNPMQYEGAGEVEPLIPLQDELNTRLSDRANRVTFQSFKMYLGKGIEGFEDQVVAPGRMWATDNPDATIEVFGGDAACPSETAHIDELRQAMDKSSGITSLAAGLLRDSVGNLTSATALRVVMMGTLARLERKRTTYGAGFVETNCLVLETLNRLGILKTDPGDRQTRIHWPSPLPDNLGERLAEAKVKRELGVPQETVLRELGYGPQV